MATSFEQYLRDAGIDEGYITDALSQTNQGINGFQIPSQLLRPTYAKDFENQARDIITPYYDKNLEIAMKQIDLAESQRKELKGIAEAQQKEAEDQYQKSDDYAFASAIRNAQSGYAGKGTSQSGFRNFGLDQQITAEEMSRKAKQTEFGNLTQNRDVGFKQFLGTSSLDREAKQLDIDRARNEALLSAQDRLATTASNKQKSIINTLNTGFAQFLGLNQALGA